jgi:APA family basic amino acid/polyamine antiporter
MLINKLIFSHDLIRKIFLKNMDTLGKEISDHEKSKHKLTLLDGTMLVAGSMIGSGIFIVSADIVRNVGSAGWLIVIWLLAGFMTVTAALSYGELSGMYPKAGGQYVYLKESYNRLVAFLYGWSFFNVIQTGTIAAVGVAFGKFTAYLIPSFSESNILFDLGFIKINATQIVSVILIVFLTLLNTFGLKWGKLIQNGFTIPKLLSLFGLIVFGFLAIKADVWHANWSNAWDLHNLNSDGHFISLTLSGTMGAIALAMVGSIFSSDAWNNVTFIAGEMKNAKRNAALSLLFGTLIVTLIYVLANVIYIGVLPMHDIAYADKDRVAIAAAQSIFGNTGTYVIAVMIMLATFGCNNGLILSGARVYYSMAKDGLFMKRAGNLNKHNVPAFGLWIQCLVASILCLTGRYSDLLDMISFVVVLFYILTIIGIYILRIKYPNAERPYKAIGYPILPALYILMGLTFCTLLIFYKPQFTWPGIIIVLIGIPIYYLQERSNRKNNVNDGSILPDQDKRK